jgi:FkbM family methyltransferase
MGRAFFLDLLVNILRLCRPYMPRSSFIHRLCRAYVDYYNGDNNCDIQRNGELRWMKEVIPRCTTLFDAGANVGDWTDLALQINPLAKAHCFEPCPATFQRLQERTFGRSVVLNQSALGGHPGEAEMYLFDACSTVNSLYRRQGLNARQEQTETIMVDTLDAYCERENIKQIDFLKIDVEGHELEVLKGGSRMLGQGRIERIQFEYGGTFIDAGILLKDMFELLNSYGFVLHKIYPGELRPMTEYRQDLESFQQSNWAALKSPI